MTNGNSRCVVVTGGTGFLGTYVCKALIAKGYRVIPVGSSDYDLTEQHHVRALYSNESPDIVVHLAASCGGIGANVANPGLFLYANAMMGLALLEEGRKAGLQKFVLISTTCAYPERAPIPLHEKDMWEGRPTSSTGFYGIAKRMLHEACRSYYQQYGLNSVVLVPANLYGPGDHYDPENSHVIAALIRRYVEAMRGGETEVTNWGSGSPTREFLHARDAAEAICLAVQIGDIGCEPINIGTGQETSIRTLATLVAKAVGYTGSTCWDSSKPDGQPRRSLDVSRAQKVLGFKAGIGLEEGICETVKAYLEQQVHV